MATHAMRPPATRPIAICSAPRNLLHSGLCQETHHGHSGGHCGHSSCHFGNSGSNDSRPVLCSPFPFGRQGVAFVTDGDTDGDQGDCFWI
jgi:hypothetical protein